MAQNHFECAFRTPDFTPDVIQPSLLSSSKASVHSRKPKSVLQPPLRTPSLLLASSIDLPILDIFMQMALHDLWLLYLFLLAYYSLGSSV